MSLLNLPNELIESIIALLWEEADLNAVVRTNRELYSMFNTYLYAHNIRRCELYELPYPRYALVWIAQNEGPSSAFELALDAKKQSSSEAATHLGHKAFEQAVFHGRADLIEMMLSQDDCSGVHPNSVNEAVIRGHEDLVKALVASGLFDLNWPGRYQRTPLFQAICHGHIEIVRILVAAVNINQQMWIAALTKAAENRDHEIVQLLLVAKAAK
ncbi:unnamed protein product [Clonostachys rosea]|uniref:F-box domain-containing protein n=1 Tax=Bionectria ochroleuca TaxID=29856 RepID=A0ABY6UD60_BIOOC|nr:unnamed protein product [Clonostachys rosea]